MTVARPARTAGPGDVTSWWVRPPGWLPAAARGGRARRWWFRAVGVLLVVAAGACLAVGADRPADPRVAPADLMAGLAGHSSPTSRVPGFGQIGFRVATPAGPNRLGPRRCALLADTGPSVAAGMMGRRALSGYDAMVFRFFGDTNASFYNKGVPIPLSVAWFDAAGVLVGTASLAVCSATCPTVAPAQAYRVAVEVPAGGLRRLGIGPGSALVVGGGCGG